MRIAKFLLPAGLVAGVALAVGTGAMAQPLLHPGGSANGEDPFLLSFDENGTATIAENGGTAAPLAGTLISDPSNPADLVLAYPLPEAVITGTVEISDPSGAISDALRFTDASGTISGVPTGAGPEMIYYSDLVPDPGNLTQPADTGFPANLTSGNFVAGPTEAVGLAATSFDYLPAGIPYPGDNEYRGISDVAAAPPVPEPGSLALLGTGLAVIGLLVRRRRRPPSWPDFSRPKPAIAMSEGSTTDIGSARVPRSTEQAILRRKSYARTGSALRDSFGHASYRCRRCRQHRPHGGTG